MRFLIHAFLLSAAVVFLRADESPITEVDHLIANGNFKEALVRLGSLNRNRAQVSLGWVLGKEPRDIAALPVPSSPFSIQIRALFERGEWAYLNGKPEDAARQWSTAFTLPGQTNDSAANHDLRRIGSALFMLGISGKPNIEAFNRSLKTCADQIDLLPVPVQAATFSRQLASEFEIYATYRVIASVFSQNETEANQVNPELWTDLFSRKKLNDLITRPSGDLIEKRAYEGIFDAAFYSDKARLTFHKHLLLNCLNSISLTGSERYSRGLARLVALQSLSYPPQPEFSWNDPALQLLPINWPLFSSEIIPILECSVKAGATETSSRIAITLVPVLDRLSLTPGDALMVANTLLEAGKANVAYGFCSNLAKTVAEEPAHTRFTALQVVALGQLGKFPEAIAAAEKITQLQFLAADDLVTLEYTKSVAYAQVGNPQASIQACLALLKVAPNHKLASKAYLGMALQYLNLGDKVKARATLSQYLARYPDADSSDFARKCLESL
ncbi:MAG: hypothetical protein WC661_18840 [Opitutaceae bacterium]|jgi:tetratricopeptide (TPR) repeat protein